jgi:uncharacterized protein with HEPN domain
MDKVSKYLFDISNSITLIESFLVGVVDFRNRIIHSYDNIDASIVWVIVKRHLPILREGVNGYIEI